MRAWRALRAAGAAVLRDGGVQPPEASGVESVLADCAMQSTTVIS
jgi:hypothetical protein